MINFNLIDEKWIPVKRSDGSETMIAPWEITKEFVDNPIVTLNAPRPDFNGALIQLLIGLVQTTFAPAHRIEWKQKLNKPPEPEELKAAFMTVHDAFELGGDGPRFMQAFEVLNDVTPTSIAGLLIDAPGENALEHNTDHFFKRGIIKKMCAGCCSMALFTSQINAYGDGPGYRTSLRGGSGPLTTLIIGDEKHNTLWQMIWLNILEQNSFLSLCGNPEKDRPEDIFPWLAPTRTSEKSTGVETTPMDVHPAQMLWSMSQRIRCVIDQNEAGTCDLCGATCANTIEIYYKKNYGVNYVGSWLHHLTPYGRKEDGTTIPEHGQKGGLTYRHWLGYVQYDSKNKKEPARIVHEFYERQKQKIDWQFRLWIFGFDIYNSAKIRCWYEAKMPLLVSDGDSLKVIEHEVANMVVSSSEVISNTKSAIKHALFSKVKEIKKTGKVVWDTPATIENKKELFYQIATIFWHDTEQMFYQTLSRHKSSVGSSNDSLKIRTDWHEALCREARYLFDAYALEVPIEDTDPKRVVIARSELEKFNRSKEIKELLDLPLEQQPKDTATKKIDKAKRKAELNL